MQINKNYSGIFILVILGLCSTNGNAQTGKDTSSNDIYKMMEESTKQDAKSNIDYSTATFKSTRIINGQSIETIGKYNLDFRISHRFGPLNAGGNNLWGLDGPATIRLGLDYGLTNTIMLGVGRSNLDKEYDAYAKIKLLRQSTGKTNMPISVTWLSSILLQTVKDADPAYKTPFKDRISYVHQLLIARKFSEGLSLQLSPTLVHYNMVDYTHNSNDLFSLGIGIRQKLSKRVSINAEFFPQFKQLDGAENSFSVGFDIETGGHVFQLHFTNSTGMTERTFITKTTENWGNGGVHFGFNISRIFVLKKTVASKAW